MAKKTEKQKALEKLQADMKALQAELAEHYKTFGAAPKILEERMAGLMAAEAHLQGEA